MKLKIIDTWLRAHNIHIHPDVHLVFESEQFRMLAKAFIPSETVIARIPSNSILSPVNCSLSHELTESNIHGAISLVIAVMAEFLSESDSIWYFYFIFINAHFQA